MSVLNENKTHQSLHEIRIRPPRMDMGVRVEASDVGVWGFGWCFRDVAEADDPVGLLLGPGEVVAGRGAWVCAGAGCVGGGHGVVGVVVVFGVHFGGVWWYGWWVGGRRLWWLGGFEEGRGCWKVVEFMC